MNPQVTVLMPVFNASKYLREAMDSILVQSFKDFEFLIIDDGSTDDSVEIINTYQDPRIRLLKNENNLGISDTLNKGIERSSTSLIARMDADDISHPSRLEKQVQYMDNHPQCALLSTWANVVDQHKKFVRLERYRTEFYYYNLTFECWMYHSTIMFRKDMIQAVGSYSMKYSEDYDLFWKVSQRFEIGNLMEALVDYRLSPTSLNTVLKKDQYDLANKQNVVRNIRHYLSDEASLSNEALECLRHNFEPIVKEGSIQKVFEAFGSLKKITDRIAQKPNPNRDEPSIYLAYYFKRQFIIAELLKKLPWFKSLLLLFGARGWVPLYFVATNSMTWRFRRILRAF
jgi:glycosyltransferase involved in cell wall biosynthesis